MDILSSLPKIEGIGHEVLISGSIAFTLLVLLAYLVNRQIRSGGSQAIHPSSAQAVNNARNQLNVSYSNRFLSETRLDGEENSDDNSLNGNFKLLVISFREYNLVPFSNFLSFMIRFGIVGEYKGNN